jgi:hypothetical protein
MNMPVLLKENLRARLYATAESAGLKILSDDKCCRLLAWLHVCGGTNEQTVLDSRLSNALLYAQNRLNLLGGEIPDAELLPVLMGYIRSIIDYKNPPEWVLELEKEYGIKPHRGRWD